MRIAWFHAFIVIVEFWIAGHFIKRGLVTGANETLHMSVGFSFIAIGLVWLVNGVLEALSK